jgi:hypothetical protein
MAYILKDFSCLHVSVFIQEGEEKGLGKEIKTSLLFPFLSKKRIWLKYFV